MKNEISKYIKSGCKNSKLLGLEIEHFILDENNNSVFYSYENNKIGIQDIIEELSIYYSENIYENFNGKKYLIGLKRDNAEISIEPGAQFEVSLPASSNIKEIEKNYVQFREEVEKVLAEHNYHLANIGYRPDACALEVPIIPKMRYICMDANFKTVNTQGFCMMRCSAATQITIDFKNEDDCKRKMKVATCLSPLFYFLLDNSPIFERKKIGESKFSKSGIPVPKRMARWQIWNNADDDRCASSPVIFNDFSFENYSNLIENMPEIYNPLNFSNKDEECKHKISMNFFDVRLKDTIEIRCADSMPQDFTFAYVALIQKLYYNEKTLNSLWGIFKNTSFKDYKLAGQNLTDEGWDAQIYGYKTTDLFDKILEIVDEKNNSDFESIANLIQKRTVLKDYLNENYPEINGEFKPVSNTVKYTNMQVDSFDKCKKDLPDFVEKRKNSKVEYMSKVSSTGYFSKVFDIGNKIEFEMIVSKTCKILEKVYAEYFSNPEYQKLWTWDDFSKHLIHFKPKHKSFIPIARFDIFFNDETGSFEFCEFNTGGSAAMSKATYACEEIKQTLPYKNIKCCFEQKDVFNSWVKEFSNIYKEWAGKKLKNLAIVDQLDNCQLPDFEPFKNCFNQAGFNCEIVDIRDLRFDGEYLRTPKDTKLDAIYKRITLNDLINIKDNDGVKAMIDAVLSEKVCSIDWFNTQIFHDKQIFYILHKDETKKLLSPSEISFIEKSIPLTYKLNTKNFTNKDFINNKDEWIIKPLNSRDSINVYAGKDMDSHKWEQTIEKLSKTNNYIIQHFCKIYESPNVWINPANAKASINNGIKLYCNMEGLYCYNLKFEGMYLRQGSHDKDSINFDMAIPVFYECYKN